MAGGITVRSGSSNSDVSAVKMVSGNSVTDVTAVYQVSGNTATQIWPESQYTVSGTITDSVTNGSVSQSSYSFSGVAGQNFSGSDAITITVTADDDFKFTNANSVTITESPSASFVTTGKTINADRTVITITIAATIQTESKTVNLTLSGSATQNTYTTGGNITGTIQNASYSPTTWSITGITGATQTGSTTVQPNADYEFVDTNGVQITTTPVGMSNVQKNLSNGNLVISWTETVQQGGSSGNLVISGGATPSNNAPTVTLASSNATPNVGTAVTLTASASDPDGDTLSYSWSVVEGTNCGLTDADSSTRSVNRSSPGTCKYRVTVSDGNGGTDSADTSVTWSYPAFECDDWTGNFQVSLSGVVTVQTLGNAQTVQNISENCGDNSNGCMNVTCQVTSYQITIPSSGLYSNAGSTITCNTSADYITLTQGFGGTNWTSSDWTGSVTISGNGTINLTQGNATSIESTPSSYSNNDTCSAIQRTPALKLGIPTGYCNSGFINYVPSVSQPANKPDWGSSDWTGSVSVSSNGTISCNKGNAQSCTVLTSKFSANNTCNSITRTGIQVRVVAPSGECNAGSNVTVSGLSASQPQSVSAEYEFSDWNGSFTVNPAGTVTCSAGNSAGCSTNPSSFSANSGCSSITRNATATITVPSSGYCNSSETVSGAVSASQSGSGTNWNSGLWTGSCSADSDGDVTCVQGNATSVSILNENCQGNSGCSSNTCTATAVLGVPSGYCNSGGTINYPHSINQAAGGVNLTCSNLNFSVNVVAAGTYSTSYDTSDVSGTPSFSPSSFSTVSVATLRTVTGVFTPASNYCNSGNLTCYASDTQEATQAQVCYNWRLNKPTGTSFAQWTYTNCAGNTSIATLTGFSAASTTVCVRSGTSVAPNSGFGITQTNLNTTCS